MAFQFIKNLFKKPVTEQKFEYKVPTIESVKKYPLPVRFGASNNLDSVKRAIEQWHSVLFKYSDFGTKDDVIDQQFQIALREYIDNGSIIIPKSNEWMLWKSGIKTSAGTEMSGALMSVITTIGKIRNNPTEFQKVVNYLNTEVLWK